MGEKTELITAQEIITLISRINNGNDYNFVCGVLFSVSVNVSD